MSDEDYMKKALQEAKEALKIGEVPIGAVIVCNDSIIAKAHNMTQHLTDVTAHAEMQAITAASDLLGGKYLSECTLYVTIEPCVMCAGALGWTHIKRIVYGAKDPKKGYHIFAPKVLHPKTECIGGIMEKECSQILTAFFKKKR
jgi:tRNA(adenine34) deaminase